MQGYDLNLINKVSKKINIPLIASGGAGSYKDIKYDAFLNQVHRLWQLVLYFILLN